MTSAPLFVPPAAGLSRAYRWPPAAGWPAAPWPAAPWPAARWPAARPPLNDSHLVRLHWGESCATWRAAGHRRAGNAARDPRCRRAPGERRPAFRTRPRSPTSHNSHGAQVGPDPAGVGGERRGPEASVAGLAPGSAAGGRRPIDLRASDHVVLRRPVESRKSLRSRHIHCFRPASVGVGAQEGLPPAASRPFHPRSVGPQ